MEELPPTPPSLAVGRATMAMLGKRTGVVVDARKPKKYSQQDEEEDDDDTLDHYMASAVAAAPVTQELPASRTKKIPSSILKKKSNKSNRPRFSMPGVDEDGQEYEHIEEEPEPSNAKSSKYMRKVVSNKDKVDFSPGDVSRASTALTTTPGSRDDPSTPRTRQTPRSELLGSPIHETQHDDMLETPQRDQEDNESDDEEMEVSRTNERTPYAQERSQRSPAAVKPVSEPIAEEEDDEEEDDDMIPPPPPDEPPESDIPEPQPDVATSPRAESEEDDDDDRRNDFPDDNDDFDDDDKEGAGFQITGTPAAPSESDEDEQERILDKKRRVKESLEARRKQKENEAKKQKNKEPARKLKTSKPQKKARFVSPQGIQARDREFDEIPVDRYKHSPDDKNLRRSNRARCQPLQYWKNERIIYGPNDDPEVMGLMPVPVSILTAQPTPYKKINRQAKRKRGAKDDEDSESESNEEDSNPPFDSTKLRKKFKFIDGEVAFVWEDSVDDSRDMKVVSYFESKLMSDLPLGTRKKSESKVVGHVGHGFDLPGDDNRNGGSITGSLVLPRKGIKDAESVGNCRQIFTVCHCQPGSLELDISHPDEPPGTMNPETASRFLLNSFDLFQVPPENTYRLENHSTTTDCVLSWVMMRPGEG